MHCTEPRLVDLCSRLFKILTSGESKGEVHGIEVDVRETKTGSRLCNVKVGLMNIDMIFKPYNITEQGANGSDEGANVFLALPFQDNTNQGIRIPCYYTERSGSPVLMASVPNGMSSKATSSVRRVVSKRANPDVTAPF